MGQELPPRPPRRKTIHIGPDGRKVYPDRPPARYEGDGEDFSGCIGLLICLSFTIGFLFGLAILGLQVAEVIDIFSR